MTDAEWERVGPVLPPQKLRNGSGRRHDHRTVLAGILWVDRADGSWRETPEQFGKWQTAYKRYRLWADRGRWQCIATTLGIQDAPPSAD